ncbi:histidine triad nucleotide-binding protein [Desulfitibacter alkalitolerans]|uniref:histidine triad nucleotide-binding protein n=1 Tax=Desulfitibacter alkalitolerans TaxID=264641 RepID=UPI00048928B9|nr:histidine triad nucleotide-binding protein [Desulfitibacter alkalitolerans]
MSNCIFCKIINKEIPSTIVYEDDEVLAFNDINPQAPIHILIIPKKHISDMTEVTEEDIGLIGKIHLAAVKIAKQKGFAEKGFRLVNNCKADGGQIVFHLHYHLMAGKKLPVCT